MKRFALCSVLNGGRFDLWAYARRVFGQSESRLKQHCNGVMSGLALALLFAGPGFAECRQALALALDVSGSVDAREYRLQLDGVATALRAPEVQAAFMADPNAPLRLMIFEWSGIDSKRVLLPWVSIVSTDQLNRIALQLNQTAASHTKDRSTALTSAMLFGAEALQSQAECWQKTLDVSGDGPGNIGAHPQSLSDERLGWITINGLVISPTGRANTTKNLSNVKSLETYYRDYVLRGPGAFAELAQSYAEFAEAMQRKLIKELRLPNLSGLDSHPLPQ